MKNRNLFLFLFLIFCGCSNESIDDLTYNILDDKSVPLVMFSSPSTGLNSASVGFTSIYDQLTPEAQASITHYNVYVNELERGTLPLSAERVGASGVSGSVVCIALAFASSEGESRLSSTYCISIP